MSRRLHVLLALMIAASAFLLLGADSCSGSIALKREGEPCTRTSECSSGLACSGGTCRPAADAGDASASDAGADATP